MQTACAWSLHVTSDLRTEPGGVSGFQQAAQRTLRHLPRQRGCAVRHRMLLVPHLPMHLRQVEQRHRVRLVGRAGRGGGPARRLVRRLRPWSLRPFGCPGLRRRCSRGPATRACGSAARPRGRGGLGIALLRKLLCSSCDRAVMACTAWRSGRWRAGRACLPRLARSASLRNTRRLQRLIMLMCLRGRARRQVLAVERLGGLQALQRRLQLVALAVLQRKRLVRPQKEQGVARQRCLKGWHAGCDSGLSVGQMVRVEQQQAAADLQLRNRQRQRWIAGM